MADSFTFSVAFSKNGPAGKSSSRVSVASPLPMSAADYVPPEDRMLSTQVMCPSQVMANSIGSAIADAPSSLGRETFAYPANVPQAVARSYLHGPPALSGSVGDYIFLTPGGLGPSGAVMGGAEPAGATRAGTPAVVSFRVFLLSSSVFVPFPWRCTRSWVRRPWVPWPPS